MTNKINKIVLYLLIAFSIYCALIIGLSWDELAHLERGNARLKYLFSFGSHEYLDYRDQRYYPGFYNTLVVFITKLFPKKIEFEILHLTNNLFSILTIFGISKISSELFNKKVGKIVFVLCFLNPIFFGHMAINQKDIIVAFSNVWATYLIIRYLKNQQIYKKRNRYVLLAGLIIGIGVGVRLVFIGTLLPIIIVSILDILFWKKLSIKIFSYKKLFVDLIKIFIVAYIVMISCWPDVHKNIFILPYELLIESFQHSFGVPLGLLNGDFYNTAETPKLYLITNLFYKLPEFILFCYVVFIILIIKNKIFFNTRFKYFNTKLILIIFIIIFPNLFLLTSPYRIYDGLRLFLYLLPYICIIPALTIYYFIDNYKNLFSKFFLVTIFSMFLYYLVIFFSLTPYQYVYLNLFIGDYSNADKKFENDYWATSLKELIKKIPQDTNLISSDKTIKLSFCGVPHNLVEKELNKLKNFKYEKKDFFNEDYDYIIMTNKGTRDRDSNDLKNVQTCFQKIKGIDIIKVEKNGLMLSTLRKKL